MNLDELQSVQSKERRNSSLQHLRDSFYDDVGEYVAELKNRRDLAADRADDPFSSPEVRRLTDEIETAEEVVEKIYERRMGKLVKQASLAAAGMSADTEGMTVQERELFDDIVANIEANKESVLATLSGEEADPDPAETEAGDAGVGAASMMGKGEAGEPEQSAPTPEGATPSAETDAPSPAPGESSDAAAPAAPDTGGDPTEEAPTLGADPDAADEGADDEADRPPAEADAILGTDGAERTDGGATTADPPEAVVGGGDGGAETDRVTVRVTTDVGSIYGVDDREYDLERSDVVQLPAQNAEPLLQQDAAERLDDD
jgi:DNA replication factor GINS